MTQFAKLLFFLAFNAYCGIRQIRSLQLFRKQFKIFEKFQNWLIKGNKLRGPSFDAIFEIIIFSCFYAYCGICEIRNLRLFRKRFEIFEKFQNWLIKGKKLMGPFNDANFEIIIFSCFLCVLQNLQISQFANISQTV